MAKRKKNKHLRAKKFTTNEKTSLQKTSDSSWCDFFKPVIPTYKLPFELPQFNLIPNGLRINGFPIALSNIGPLAGLLFFTSSFLTIVNAEVDKLNHKIFTNPSNHTLYRLDTLIGYWYANAMDHEAVANYIISQCKGIMKNSNLTDFEPIKDMYATVVLTGNKKSYEIVQRLLRFIGQSGDEEFENCLVKLMKDTLNPQQNSSSTSNAFFITGLVLGSLAFLIASYFLYKKVKAFRNKPESIPLLEKQKQNEVDAEQQAMPNLM